MKLNEKLNLVLPVGDRQAYHTPISREVFEANYRILAATKAAVSSKGIYYQMDAGPRIAALALKDEAKKDAEERGDEFDSAKALVEEIKRLTMILCPSERGWDMLPVDAAISAGHIDLDDWREAESAIVFFTCLWSLAAKTDKPKVATATAGLLKASTTPLTPSEFVASLLDSTTTQSQVAAVSSVPS